MLPLQGTWVPSLLGELKSYKPCSPKKKKKAKQCILYNVVDARKMVNSEASVARIERITVREEEVASGAHGAGMMGPTVL